MRRTAAALLRQLALARAALHSPSAAEQAETQLALVEVLDQPDTRLVIERFVVALNVVGDPHRAAEMARGEGG